MSFLFLQFKKSVDHRSCVTVLTTRQAVAIRAEPTTEISTIYEPNRTEQE